MSEENGRHAISNRNIRQISRWWWFGQLLLAGIASFFVIFGISLLIASYRLGDPFSFIMTFFAASLIILISVVMVLGFVIRMRRMKLTDRSINDHEAE